MNWLLMAAGSSRRFGSAKLLATLDTKPVGTVPGHVTLIEAAVRNLRETDWPVRVVVREHDVELRRVLDDLQVETLPVTSSGLGDSIAAAVRVQRRQAAVTVEALGIALADMPFVPPDLLRQLIARVDHEHIVRPVHQPSGKPGHPVIFGRDFFARLEQCSGDRGAQGVVAAAGPALRLVPTSSEGCLIDVDTPVDLQRAQGMLLSPARH